MVISKRGYRKKMPTIRSQNGNSTAKLLKATADLNSFELDNFVSQAIALRAQRRAPNLSQNETELLLAINKGISPRIQKRFDELAEKLESETMTAAEREEFLKLTNRIEKQDARRVELLGKLAEFRKQTLDEIMKDLGIGQI